MPSTSKEDLENLEQTYKRVENDFFTDIDELTEFALATSAVNSSYAEIIIALKNEIIRLANKLDYDVEFCNNAKKVLVGIYPRGLYNNRVAKYKKKIAKD